MPAKRRAFDAAIYKVGAVAVLLCLTTALAYPVGAHAQSSVRPPEHATVNAQPGPVDGEVPGDALGSTSDAEIWRAVRHGLSGTVSIPDKKAATLVQSEGEVWRLIRTGPFFDYLGMAMLGTVVLLALFFAIRGRIRVEHGMSGRTITRFSTFERTAHWLTALSFIILGLTGLNISYGRELILPLIGKDSFGLMTAYLKAIHHYVAFAFMLGLATAFVTWVVHNIPNRYDLVWLAKGGGFFSKHSHPPARKFNAGQKIIFWLVMLGGFSLSLSGWASLFPFHYHFFGDTVAALSHIGINLPALIGIPEPPYSVIQEQQYNSIWHAMVAVGMVCLILVHIYIGSIGMEGAFDAMGKGEVDINWAKEHHSLWVEELDARETGSATTQPAE
jgi:formate dehydrogenase subunit gamma